MIRYEDLITHPDVLMGQCCEFLDIPFEKVLLTPTFRGNPWGGNSTTGDQFKGIDASNLERWKSSIKAMEVEYINKLLPFVLRDYGYERFQPRGSFWTPIRGESLKRYLANRFYRFLLQEWRNPAKPGE